MDHLTSIGQIVQFLTTVVAFIAAWQARRAAKLGEQNASKLKDVHQEVQTVAKQVNGMTDERVQAEKDRGKQAVAAAVELGSAKAETARAQGHSEGVAVEQERGVMEQIRIKNAGSDKENKK